MFPCESCGRHVRHVDSVCPFCASPREAGVAPSRPGRLQLALGAIVAPIVLAACYGGPPNDTACPSDDPACDTDTDPGDTDTDTP